MLSVVLRHQSYRRLFTAQVIALLGTGVMTVALALLADELAPGSASTVVATTLTIKMVTYVIGSPLMSAATRRLRPRSVLVTADLTRIAAVAALPWVNQPIQAYCLMAALYLASATFTPAFQALIPDVLPDEASYTQALSLSRLAYDLEALVSPALAGLILLMVDANDLFLIASAGFAISATCVVLTRSAPLFHPRNTSDTRGFWVQATQGLTVMVHRRPLRALLAVDFTVACGTAWVLVATTVVIHDDLVADESLFTTTLAAYGLGSMTSALMAAHLARHLRIRTILLGGCALTALALAGGAAAVSSGRWPWVIALWLLLGYATGSATTLSSRVVVAATEAHERAAVFAARFSTSHASFLVTYPLTGFALAHLQTAKTALLLSAIALISTLIARRLSPP